MTSAEYDLVVIGGGINGVGIGRDAQGRGIRTLVVEKDDLGSGTSSASTKLIHGGLRYLETYEFKMVGEALSEREVIMRSAPHLVWPLRFVIPHTPEQRPYWLVRLGLVLYDFLGKRKILPGSRGVNLRKEVAGKPLQDHLVRGFEYSDCWAQDAKLVALNAMDLVRRGGEVRTQTSVERADRVDNGQRWCVTLRDTATGQTSQVMARAVVNAAGPWADVVDGQVLGRNNPTALRLVRGSHIIVPKLYDEDQAYLLQNHDGRVIFVIPYEGDFSLIGTTDVEHDDSADRVMISHDEIQYLCAAVNRYFKKQLCGDDVVWTYAGVRPLVEQEGVDASKVSRDYDFELDGDPHGDAPLLTVLGGKLTAYRELSEDAIAKLLPFFQSARGPWTRQAVLPGGEVGLNIAQAKRDFAARYPFLPVTLANRLVQDYGALAEVMLQGATSLQDLGVHLGEQVYEAELRHLRDQEFVKRGEDWLWRRSKMGLHLSQETQKAVNAWFAAA